MSARLFEKETEISLVSENNSLLGQNGFDSELVASLKRVNRQRGKKWMHAVIKAEGNRGIARSLTCRKSLDFRRSEVKVCITTDEDEYLGN